MCILLVISCCFRWYTWLVWVLDEVWLLEVIHSSLRYYMNCNIALEPCDLYTINYSLQFFPPVPTDMTSVEFIDLEVKLIRVTGCFQVGGSESRCLLTISSISWVNVTSNNWVPTKRVTDVLSLEQILFVWRLTDRPTIKLQRSLQHNTIYPCQLYSITLIIAVLLMPGFMN